MSHVAWSVCLCVKHMGELCKNGGTNRNAIWGLSDIGPRNHVLDEDQNLSMEWDRAVNISVLTSLPELNWSSSVVFVFMLHLFWKTTSRKNFSFLYIVYMRAFMFLYCIQHMLMLWLPYGIINHVWETQVFIGRMSLYHPTHSINALKTRNNKWENK